MALQYVGGNVATKAGATSGNSTISLTTLTGGLATSASAGDFVIAVYATGSTADRALTITDGTTAYTLIGTELYANGTSYDTNLRVAYKRLTVADASVTFGPTGNAADAGAMAVHVWRGVDSNTPLDVAATTATGTATGRPNPAAITPTTSGSVIIIAGAGAAATGAVFTAAYLSNFRTATSIDTQDAMVGVGSIAWTSGAYDGAQWTGGTANAADSWAAVTIALRPAVDATLTPSLFTNSNTFYAPTITQAAGVQDLTASLFTNTQTFYSETVTTNYTVTPSLYTNSNTFYAESIAVGAVNLSPSLFTNTNTFYSALITQAALDQTLLVNRFDNANTFYSARIDNQIFAEIYNNTNSFYNPSITTSYSVVVDLFNNSNTFYSATVDSGFATQQLTPQRFNNTTQFFEILIYGQVQENVVQGYFENRRKPTKKEKEQKVEVPDYDEELSILLLMS